MENQFEFLMNNLQNMNDSANIQSSIFNLSLQIFNMGIQMVSVGTQIQNIGKAINIYKTQIQNIGLQIQNLGNKINDDINNNNIMMQNYLNMNNNMIINQNDDDDWMKGFQMGVEEANNINDNIINDDEDWMQRFKMGVKVDNNPKMNFIFTTTSGNKKLLSIPFGTTVGDVLKKYLIEINRPELINKDGIIFSYNANKITFDNKTKIGDYFKSNLCPKIVVNFSWYL